MIWTMMIIPNGIKYVLCVEFISCPIIFIYVILWSDSELRKSKKDCLLKKQLQTILSSSGSIQDLFSEAH